MFVKFLFVKEVLYKDAESEAFCVVSYAHEIIRSQESGQVKRTNKEPISYKITEEKYKDLDITPQ